MRSENDAEVTRVTSFSDQWNDHMQIQASGAFGQSAMLCGAQSFVALNPGKDASPPSGPTGTSIKVTLNW